MQAMYPSVPHREGTLPSGKKITYVDFLDVMEDMFAHADLSNMQWSYQFNGSYGHPMTTWRCKEMQMYASPHCPIAPAWRPLITHNLMVTFLPCRLMHRQAHADKRHHHDCRLTAPIFYQDGAETRRLRGLQNDAIFFSLGNVSAGEHLSSAGKLLLCIVPEGEDVMEALKMIIIKSLHKLENGCKFYFATDQRSYWCYGSAFAILGDHPALAKTAGVLFSPFCFLRYLLRCVGCL